MSLSVPCFSKLRNRRQWRIIYLRANALDSLENMHQEDSDDEIDSSEDTNELPVVQGYLCKWTNYIHGWQDRYIICKDGTLSYYKTPDETAFGCRGALSLAKATILPHKFDDCRFDLTWGEQIWFVSFLICYLERSNLLHFALFYTCRYLRANSHEHRHFWLKGLEDHLSFGNDLENNTLRRHNSVLSIASAASLSTASTSSFIRGQDMREKISEMEHFRDILCKQVETLQSYFDLCSDLSHDSLLESHDDGENTLTTLSLKSQKQADVKELKDGSVDSNSGGLFGLGNFFRRERNLAVTVQPNNDRQCSENH